MTRSISTSATDSNSGLKHFGRIAGRVCLALAALGATAPAHAASAPTLQELLDRVGRQAQQFWNNFSSVTCTEAVTQSKLGEKDKVLSVQRQTFDYLIALQAAGPDISVDESRLEKVSSHSKAKASLLETNGFGIFSLMFHPLYQSRFQFQQLPDEMFRGHRLISIGFQQVTRDHPLSVLQLRELEYPLQWRGKAWIDPDSWAVLRIQAGLGDSMADVGLLRLDVDVTYSDVRFNSTTVYWLPVTAVIDAETKRQRWHNTHAFTAYKRFAVDTDSKILSPQ